MIVRHQEITHLRIQCHVITLRRFFALPSLPFFFAERLRFSGAFSFSKARLRFLGITTLEARGAARAVASAMSPISTAQHHTLIFGAMSTYNI